MKKVILMLVLFLLFIPRLSWAQEEFRGIKWGINISELKDMIPEETIQKPGPDIKYYTRKGEENKIGDIPINKIIYAFYKDQFWAVTINFDDYSNYQSLLAGLSSKYGQASRPNRYIEEYNWFGISSLHLGIKYSDKPKRGSIFYYYKPVSNQMMEDRKKAGEKAKQGL
jgi:hypothetical protein